MAIVLQQGDGRRRRRHRGAAGRPGPGTPTDGGTYEQAIAKLTVDKNGVHGDEPGFDKNNVKIYGLGLPGSGGAHGQTEWSTSPARTAGPTRDKNPWGTKYNFDDPKFQETIAWWPALIDKGYMPTAGDRPSARA